MKQRHQNTSGGAKGSSIAWFKLAELISRGEKEKALNLYRLLSHSFEERAYILQLEGDILWAFEDKEAVDRYKQAAFLYQKENRAISAVAIYEHLITLQSKNYDHLYNAILLHAQIGWGDKVMHCFNLLFNLFENGSVSQDQIIAVLDKVKTIIDRNEFKKLLSFIKKRSSGFAKDYGKEG